MTTYTISSGQTLSGTLLFGGDTLSVLSGGEVEDITLQSGGAENVFFSGANDFIDSRAFVSSARATAMDLARSLAPRRERVGSRRP